MSQAAEVKRERKYVAWERLKKEGRYNDFCLRKAFYRSKEGGGLKRDEAFYAALAEFPPIQESEE